MRIWKTAEQRAAERELEAWMASLPDNDIPASPPEQFRVDVLGALMMAAVSVLGILLMAVLAR